MTETYWKKWSQDSGDGFHTVRMSYYKQLCEVGTDNPIGEAIEISYYEYKEI